MRNEVIVFKLPRSRWHHSRGIARFGGWGRPTYSMSYALAARRLFDAAGDQLDELAIPCFYLQRHALELALKDLLSLVDSVERDAATLQEARGERVTAKPLTSDERQCLTTQHSLSKLVEMLDRVLQRASRGHVPAGWKKLVRGYESFERGSHERSRYSKVKRPPAGRRKAGKPKKVVKDALPLPP
jgi:hypothetical protein